MTAQNTLQRLRSAIIARGDKVARKTQPVKLSVALGYALAIVVALMAISNLFFGVRFVDTRVSAQEIEHLRQVNADLASKYEKLRWELSGLNSRYDDLSRRESDMRAMFELPKVDPVERQLGVGGPSEPAPQMATPAEYSAYQTASQVDALARLAQYQAEKIEEVWGALSQRKRRLDHTPSISPARGDFSRGFGMHKSPFTGEIQPHKGVDIANHRGTPVNATADGLVSSTGYERGMGKFVTIDHGFGFVTRYGHLDESLVTRGERVGRGDVIGVMGNTGHSTGPHVHYEVIRNTRHLNPLDFILDETF